MTGSSDFGASRPRRGRLECSWVRMKESKVLAINLTGAVTELCRHLVLSGINLELVDNEIVQAEAAEADFLIMAETDVGKRVRSNSI